MANINYSDIYKTEQTKENDGSIILDSIYNDDKIVVYNQNNLVSRNTSLLDFINSINVTNNKNHVVVDYNGSFASLEGFARDNDDLRNELETLENTKFDKPNGNTAQYIRGDGSRVLFPTLVQPPGAGFDFGEWDSSGTFTSGMTFEGNTGKLIVPDTTTDLRTSQIPLEGEIIYDTEENRMYFGDGSTPGGRNITTGTNLTFGIVTQLNWFYS